MKKMPNSIAVLMLLFLVFLVSSCNQVEKKANISLNGSDEIIEIGDVYTDKGATAKNEKDEELVVLIDNKVDTSKLGTYQVVYTVNYDGKVFNAVRNIEVVPPILDNVEKRLAQAAIAIKEGANSPSSVRFISINNPIDIFGEEMTDPDNDLGIPRPTFKIYTSNSLLPFYINVYFPGDYRYENPRTNAVYVEEYDLYYENMTAYISDVISAGYDDDSIFYYANNKLEP